MDRDAAMIAAHEAAEVATYAAITGSKEWADQAQQLARKAAESVAGLPDEGTRSALIRNDPVSAAVLGWLPYRDLARTIGAKPHLILPDEADAVAQDASALRLVMLARAAGRTFAEVLSEFSEVGPGGYTLKDDVPADVQQAWEELQPVLFDRASACT